MTHITLRSFLEASAVINVENLVAHCDRVRPRRRIPRWCLI